MPSVVYLRAAAQVKYDRVIVCLSFFSAFFWQCDQYTSFKVGGSLKELSIASKLAVVARTLYSKIQLFGFFVVFFLDIIVQKPRRKIIQSSLISKNAVTVISSCHEVAAVTAVHERFRLQLLIFVKMWSDV